MSLNASSCASNLYNNLLSAYASYPARTFPASFASTYKAYSQAGVLSAGGGIAGSEDESILSSFLSSFESATTSTAFAQALADYWSTCLLTPSGGSVVVTNNASTKVSAFKAAIEASITDIDTKPYYLNFITNIQNVAKTIQWTCVKPFPVPPTIETVS